MPKRERLLADLANGAELTARQIVQRYGYASEGSARKILSDLRFKGKPVNRLYTKRTPTRAKYKLGHPTQKQVGAGHSLMNMLKDPSRISIERR